MKDKNKNIYFEFITSATKGYSIDDLFEKVGRFPEIWKFSGYVFYLEKANPKNNDVFIYEPLVMDHPTYMAWTKSLSKNPSLILTEDDLVKIQQLEMAKKSTGLKI